MSFKIFLLSLHYKSNNMKKLITLLLVLLSVSSYSQNINSDEINRFYDEVVFHHEGQFTYDEYEVHKWDRDIYIYPSNNFNDSLISELNDIVCQLNDLIDPIEIFVTSDTLKANMRLYLGTPEEYRFLRSDLGLGIGGCVLWESFSSRCHKKYVDYIYEDTTPPEEELLGRLRSYGVAEDTLIMKNFPLIEIKDFSEIFSADIYINSGFNGDNIVSTMLEEITQSLGLPNDVVYEKNTLFRSGYQKNKQLTELDKQIIKLHYNDCHYKNYDRCLSLESDGIHKHF